MKTVPAHITAARQSNASTLCKVWKFTRTDGEVFAFTDHNKNLVIGGTTYLGSSVVSGSTIKGTSDLAVDDLELQGAFNADVITEHDLLGGIWDGAEFICAEVDWTQPDAGWDVQRWGWLSRVKTKGKTFVTELVGPAAKLQLQIGQLYQAQCRATLGDARCKIVLVSEAATVNAVTNRRVFTVTAGPSVPVDDPNYYQHGLITWTSGSNNGLEMEIRSYDGTTLELLLPMPYDIGTGDGFTMVAGCDHSLAVCRDRWNNVLNFRGEPHAPISDDVVRGPT